MYTRLFESILDSSINLQSVPATARWLWITMLIIADRNRTGIVDMPVERLAAKAGLSVEDTLAALELLGAPDPDSRSQAEDGRRIVPIREDTRRGWQLVNWEEYKRLANEAQQRDQTRLRVANFRERRNLAGGQSAEGYVYYACEPDGEVVKIGYSKNPWARLNELQTSNPKLQIIATEKGPPSMEHDRHKEFEEYREQREWFRIRGRLRKFIETVRNA